MFEARQEPLYISLPDMAEREPDPRAAEAGCAALCLSGRALIPLLKALNSKYRFSKASRAHPACPAGVTTVALCG